MSGGILTRVRAALKGELDASEYEAYRRAGASVYARLEAAEALRRTIKPWNPTAAQASQLLATWNAYCLQTLAERLLDADYAADPGTAGFLPTVTAEQVRRLFAGVQTWVSFAAQAEQNDSFDLSARLVLPADLPGWVESEPCPRPHLVAMRDGGHAIRDRAEAALADLLLEVPGTRLDEAARLRQLAAAAASAADYADGLYGGQVSPSLHQVIEDHLHQSLAGYYRLGQLVAMPRLIDPRGGDVPDPMQFPARGGTQPTDPWCLTDPTSRSAWGRDPAARRAIELLWANDPDPTSTLRIQHEIDAAEKAGAIARAIDEFGRPLGHYFCCPWAAVYEVRRPVVLAGQHLPVGTQFAYDVSAEEVPEGGEFVRRLVTGPFSRTDRIDYCDPTADGHHDD